MPARASHAKILLLLLAAGAAVGALLLWIALGTGREGTAEVELPDPETALPVAELARDEVELTPIPTIDDSIVAAHTTVLWPLRLELELLQADYLPTRRGVPAIGSGATARLSGQITGADEQGVRGEVRFVAGANVLHPPLLCDITGSFGADDLYPGLSIVEVSGPGIIGSRREVRLRQERETLLNIGYGKPAPVTGRVTDARGEGIIGARVAFDGQPTYSGTNGEFFIARVASGQVLAEIEAPGYAAYQELVQVAFGRGAPADRLTFTLRPSATLRIVCAERVGGPGPVQLFAVPSNAEQRVSMDAHVRNSRFPWYRVNPIEVEPGQVRTIEGLPAETFTLHGFRPAARVTQKLVRLRPGETETVQIALEAAAKVVGRVTLDGKPVKNARVALEAPNRVRATLGHLTESSYFLETQVLPNLPPGYQETRTGEDGRYVLTAWEELSPVRYVEATGPDHRTWAGRLIDVDERSVDLELREVDLGDSTLVVDFPGRWQGLPVEILIDGAPYDPVVLAPRKDLRISDLRAGSWRLRATWHGDPVVEERLFELAGEHREVVEVPPQAVEGQDEETWARAGREYPTGT